MGRLPGRVPILKCVSHRHRARVLPDGRSMCNAERCEFTGTSEELTYHVRYGVRKHADGSWSGPANTTAASLPDLIVALRLA